MSNGVDLGEFRHAYLVEVEELLATAQRHALALDGAARRGESDLCAVRELYRATHTVKGLSAMLGIEPIVAIAHRLETLLRSADRAATALGVDVVARILAGLRAIEQRVRAVAANAAVPPRTGGSARPPRRGRPAARAAAAVGGRGLARSLARRVAARR